MACPELIFLWLGNNHFSGQIPSSMEYLKNLRSLHLQNNMLSGPLPQSLQNCSSLRTLDLSINSFTGKLPRWIGKFRVSMQFLNLRSNKLQGEIPIELCNLIYLQILDIAQNNLSGRIPMCFKNLIAMTSSQRNISVSWKRNMILTAVENGSDFGTNLLSEITYNSIIQHYSTLDLEYMQKKPNESSENYRKALRLFNIGKLAKPKSTFTGSYSFTCGLEG
ncbi:Leucine-rich repeat [Dillenia turbinata]|uniref:Leucine-rich repeat n=1 Tax=Dillenia turbinata TaxID=194707 RepID=A0AAN8UN99_9MAGN